MTRLTPIQRRCRDLYIAVGDHINRKRALERRLTLGEYGFGGIVLRREQRKISRLINRLRKLKHT